MVAYSFNRRFVEPILAGTKAQTIRAERKRHARSGEQLQLYTGMRTKACKLIGKPTCTALLPITINIRASEIALWNLQTYREPGELDAFARADGFADWQEMRAFWQEKHNLAEVPAGSVVFHGVLIRWDPAYFTGIGT